MPELLSGATLTLDTRKFVMVCSFHKDHMSDSKSDVKTQQRFRLDGAVQGILVKKDQNVLSILTIPKILKSS